MYRVSFKAAMAALVLVTLAIPATADEYRDATGFSFTYPNGWTILNKSALAADFTGKLKDFKVDLDKVKVAIVGNSLDAGENVNVVMLHQEVPVNQAIAQEYVNMLTKNLQGAGITILHSECRVQKIGSNQVIVADYQSLYPGTLQVLKQRQVIFVGGGKTCIVTCTATADGYAKHAPTFDAILASFRVPASAASFGTN